MNPFLLTIGWMIAWVLIAFAMVQPPHDSLAPLAVEIKTGLK
jgi:hypothetical protein